jgi:predicted transcriptional regulator
MSDKKPGQADPGRVSPTAPDIASPSFQAWSDALSDPETRKALDAGLEDVQAGRTKPWQEVRRRMRSR